MLAESRVSPGRLRLDLVDLVRTHAGDADVVLPLCKRSRSSTEGVSYTALSAAKQRLAGQTKVELEVADFERVAPAVLGQPGRKLRR